MKIYVPADSTALAAGAEAVARALSAEARRLNVEIDIVRTGSRGLYWLEPLIEIDSEGGRIGFGPLNPADVASLLEGRLGAHPKALGLVEEIPFLKRQQRLVFERCGVIDPLSLDDYRGHGGLEGLKRAIALGATATLEEVVASGLRGRGGAGFPTGIKWRTVAGAAADQKYVVCNVDEGDSGTYADRMVLEGDPYLLIEGMAIAALTVGATKGYAYIRSEYPHGFKTFSEAVARARKAGVLGDSVLGSGKAFDIEPRLGAGAYICGEETSMLESLEGKRGLVRAKPPLPAIQGLFGKPTVINARAARNLFSWPATSSAAASSNSPSARRSASSSRISAAARVRAGRFGPCRSVDRSAPISRIISSTPSWTTRRCSQPRACSATAESSSLTTASTWPGRRDSRSISAPRKVAESARPVASARREASRPSTRSSPEKIAPPI